MLLLMEKTSENDLIEKAEFDFIYGSPEHLSEKIKDIVVDEAHTVIQWQASAFISNLQHYFKCTRIFILLTFFLQNMCFL